MEYYSIKEETLPPAMTRMSLEDIVLRELSQTESECIT